jgi:hypothetical protein
MIGAAMTAALAAPATSQTMVRLCDGIGTADFEDGSRGDIARTVSDQEPDYPGNLLRARHAPQRYGRIQPGELGWVVHRADVNRCRHRTPQALYRGEVVTSENLATDTRFAKEWRQLCQDHGIRACSGRT